MKYLLDTHTLLWYLKNSPELPDSVAAIIEDTDTQKYISTASLWEFTIKHSLHKIRFEGGIVALWEIVTANGFDILQINEAYLSQLDCLPFLHRDPFDRLLIATAITEDIIILTADKNIRRYNVKWAW